MRFGAMISQAGRVTDAPQEYIMHSFPWWEISLESKIIMDTWQAAEVVSRGTHATLAGYASV